MFGTGEEVGLVVWRRLKRWSPEEKTAVILEGLKGTSVKEVCAKYSVAETQYYKWRDHAIETR